MTTELFRTEPYRVTFEAQVTGIGPGYFTLDRSCFFPCSGLQASDVGSIENVPVRGVRRVNNEVRHFLDKADLAEFGVGDLIIASLNWERRYRTMRLHAAQHLVEAAYAAIHDRGTTIRSRVDARRARIDIVEADESADIELAAVSRWVETIVRQNLPCVYEADGSVEQRWFWHIDGLLTSACDGTHVRSTGEIGNISLKVLQNSRGLTEVEIELVDGVDTYGE